MESVQRGLFNKLWQVDQPLFTRLSDVLAELDTLAASLLRVVVGSRRFRRMAESFLRISPFALLSHTANKILGGWPDGQGNLGMG
jgi:hypothetical protein